MGVVISWTKSWSASDDGTVLGGADLGSLQSDIESHSHTSGVSTFLSLTDAPSSYASQTLKLLRANVGETALEFWTLLVNLAIQVTGILPVANGGTGATAAANAASGVVVNDSNGYLVGDGRNLTNLPDTSATQANDVETTGVTFDDDPEVTILSVAKTITSGNTVLLIASGYAHCTDFYAGEAFTFKLKQGSTIVQTLALQPHADENKIPWSCCGIVTGLSGAITFSVTVQSGGLATKGTAYGNLIVLEF